MITNFLKTSRTKDELATTLAVLREFKACESTEEWLMIPFSAWAKLEQLEEYLAHLVEGEPLKQDTLDYIAAHGQAATGVKDDDDGDELEG
jgi:hypothetical protein